MYNPTLKGLIVALKKILCALIILEAKFFWILIFQKMLSKTTTKFKSGISIRDVFCGNV